MTLSHRRSLARFPKDQSMHLSTISANGSGSAGGGRRRRAGRAAIALTVLATATAATLSFTAAPALADSCPNATLRAQNNSNQLPDCRAYELVTPVFKQGYAPSMMAISDAGRLTYLSNGNYAGNTWGYPAAPGGNGYLASRDESGWTSTGLAPSPEFTPMTPGSALGRAFPAGLSTDLSSSVWNLRRSDQSPTVTDLYRRGPDGVFTRIGAASDQTSRGNSGTTIVTSNDLSHVAYAADDGEAYEYVRGEDQRRPVSVDNAGQPLGPQCGSSPIGVGVEQSSFYHAISADGRVLFVTCLDSLDVIWARVNGATTIGVSGSQCTRAPSDPGGACGADAPAVFQGANADGTRVYFTTTQQLVNGDTDNTTDLYECDIPQGTPAPVGAVNPCPDLREVSGAASGANVQGVTRISEDGSRAYFVATGVLAPNRGANDATAVDGDDNLYVWTGDGAHPDGETRFVAKLDPADSNDVWGRDAAGRPAQTTDDGRYLVFTTYSALIDHGPQTDTDAARDIYRYDAETGALTRLTTDPAGTGGNEPGQDAHLIKIAHSALVSGLTSYPRGGMSDDGASVVFTTKEALAPSDVNDTMDTYLWHEGRVSLISSGGPSGDGAFIGVNDDAALGTTGTVQALISPSGRDVYFTTTASLVPGDIDGQVDIYDARVNGGFDQSTPSTCSGEACQSSPAAPPPVAQPTSTSATGQAGGPQTTPALTVGKLTVGQLKRIASTGRVSLSITTNTPGTLSAKATATLTRRTTPVGSAKRTVVKAGTVSLSLTLSKKARAQLKNKRKLTVKVQVRQDNVAIASTVWLKLTLPKATMKTAKKSLRTASRHAAVAKGRS